MEGGITGISIPRNYFDLSQEHAFSMEAGLIYPIYQALLLPGDVIEVEDECVVRQMPTINPSFSNFTLKTYDFVVAIRNLDKTIYRFLSGFKEYTSKVAWDKPLPKWIPSDFEKTRPGTLWDMLENPVDCIPNKKYAQLDYFRQAYGYIWDTYFRNETRQDSILVDGEPGSWAGEDLLRVNWARDYITTSLPNQLLGEPLALPIKGIGSAVWNVDNFQQKTNYTTTGIMTIKDDGNNIRNAGIYIGGSSAVTDARQGAIDVLNNNVINFADSASILLSQLTEMLAIETLQTINAIAGIRDDEFLKAHWGVAPSNEALQYPEVFGSEKIDILTSEVLQTARNEGGQDGVGDMAGHGLGVGANYKPKRFHSKEFSIYLKLAFIAPNVMYGGQGFKREYCQNSMYDFPFPELNHTPMQPIYKGELVCVSSKIPKSTDNGVTIVDGGDQDDSYNEEILGYQTNYSWFTEKLNRVSGLFKQEQYFDDKGNIAYNDNLYNWTEARFFKINYGERPAMNNDFLQCKIDNRNYQVVDETIERSQFLVWYNNKVSAWRSMSAKRLPSNLGVTRGLA